MLQVQFGPGLMPAASTRAINEETEGATTAATAGAGVADAATGATAGGVVVGVDGTVVGVEVRGDDPAEDGDDAGAVMVERTEAWAGVFPPADPTVIAAAVTPARTVRTRADRRRLPPLWIGRNAASPCLSLSTMC